MSQQPLPAPGSFPTPQDLKDIQGDIAVGFPKNNEDFVFFNIQNVANFKKDLKQFIPTISTTQDVKAVRDKINDHKAKRQPGLVKVSLINIAFSQAGLTKLGIPANASINDVPFQNGQLASAKSFNDPGTTDASGNFTPTNWLPQFKSTDPSSAIDGILVVAGESAASVDEGVAKFEHVFGTSVKEVLKVVGNVRPDKERGHEHFGFMDGISSPSVPALTGPANPGQIVVDPGVLIIGQQGDLDANNNPVQRPSWAKNGSILCYRQLSQLVPEFEKFLADNPLIFDGLTREQGSELFGARLVGRWKSGAPIDITPHEDDPVLAKDSKRNNDFDFSDGSDQSLCPFAAHIRKTNPRSDLNQFLSKNPNALKAHMIMRQGIPFGPEVTDAEKKSNTTDKKLDRGLGFVCYQSNLVNGFEFVQESWANNTGFPPAKPVTPGFDPIIGQSADGQRSLSGTDPRTQATPKSLPQEWVVSKGGQYFFVPSITTLQTKLSV